MNSNSNEDTRLKLWCGFCESVEMFHSFVAHVFKCWNFECCSRYCCCCCCCCCTQRSDAWIGYYCIHPRILSCVTTPVRWTTLLSSDAARTTTIATAISNPFCTSKPQQVIQWPDWPSLSSPIDSGLFFFPSLCLVLFIRLLVFYVLGLWKTPFKLSFMLITLH